jgi:hypothetical protein
MSASQYELLKCDDCGKTLGYIHESVKVFPPKRWIRMWVGGPRIKIEKDVFCKECFEKMRAKEMTLKA